MIREMRTMSFSAKFAAQLGLEGKDDTIPHKGQTMMLMITQKVDAEERVKALDLLRVRLVIGDIRTSSRKTSTISPIGYPQGLTRRRLWGSAFSAKALSIEPSSVEVNLRNGTAHRVCDLRAIVMMEARSSQRFLQSAE